MFNFRFYLKPEFPINYEDIEIVLEGEDFSKTFTEEDKLKINQRWKELKEEKGDLVFSTPGNLGTLHDTTNNTFTYRPTEFKINTVSVLTFKDKLLNEEIYNNFRSSGVACVVRLVDGIVIVQKRGEDVSHFENTFDCSAAGFTNVENGKLNFKKSALEKLSKELGITEGEVKEIKLTAAHTSRFDFTGNLDFLVETELTKEDIEKRFNRKLIGELHFIHQRDLPDFLVEHFGIKNDMLGEGCASFLASLDHQTFLKTVERLRKVGKVIEFGELKNGIFVKNANPYKPD